MTDNTQLVADLRAARALIAAPGGWCQGAYARTSPGGRITRLSSPNAACFCAIGALCFAKRLPEPSGIDFSALISALPRVRAGSPDHGAVGRFNDSPGRLQSEVIALYDRAIEIAEGGK